MKDNILILIILVSIYTFHDSNIYLRVEGENMLIPKVFIGDIIFGRDDDMSMSFDG